jgi:hypothetical protein
VGRRGRRAGVIYRLKESVLRGRLQLRSTRAPDTVRALYFFFPFLFEGKIQKDLGVLPRGSTSRSGFLCGATVCGHEIKLSFQDTLIPAKINNGIFVLAYNLVRLYNLNGSKLYNLII